MSDILTITNFAQQSDYQAGGFDTIMGSNYPDYSIEAGSQNMLIAEQDGKQIYREGSTVHGIWKSFSVELGAAVGVTAFNGRCDRRIAFDAESNCYTLVQVGSSSTPTHYLCHSDDYGQTWTKYVLPGNRQYARIEFNDHPTRRPANPPAVLLFNESGLLELIEPTISDGVVTVGSAITISSSGSYLIAPQHSGAGNSVLRGDGVILPSNTTLVAWPSDESPGTGTRQYVTVVVDGDVTDETLVATSISTASPDNHDVPAITLTSDGKAHVIPGQHHGDLVCVTSAAGDYTDWGSPVTIDAQVSGAGHTYMALVCDSSDRLHVVTRDASENTYHFKLNYFRRSAAGSWAKVHTLINPSRNYYGIYYHSLSILEDDGLWVTGPGILFGQILDATERATYDAAFPLEIIATYRIATSGISNGPYEYGELITGSNSQSTGRYRYAVGNTIYYNPVSAEELESAETLTGGTSGATATSSGAPVATINVNNIYYDLQPHQRCHWPFALYSNDGGDTWQASTLTFDNTGVVFGDVECGEFIEFEDVECSPIIAFDLEALPA